MILDEYLPLIVIAIFNIVVKFLGSCYFLLKKKFHFSTICLIWFTINFILSIVFCVIAGFDFISVQLILIASFISFVFSTVNILLTFVFKFFKKKFNSFKSDFLFIVLVIILNMGISILIAWINIIPNWIGGKFLTYYNYGLVILVLILLGWHFFEMKNKKSKSTKTSSE